MPTLLTTEKSVRQLNIELIDDRGGLQKLDHRLGLLLKHLFDEKVRHDSLTPRESSDERGRVGFVLKRQRRQSHSSQPSLSSPGQGGNVLGGEIETELLHDGPGILLLQPEVSLADLSQSSLGPPTVERQCRIDPGRDNDVQGRGEPLDKSGQSTLRGGSDDVEVIEEQPCRSRPVSQFVD